MALWDTPLPPVMPPLSRDEMASRISAALADNNIQGISAEDVRSRLLEMVDSFEFLGGPMHGAANVEDWRGYHGDPSDTAAFQDAVAANPGALTALPQTYVLQAPVSLPYNLLFFAHGDNTIVRQDPAAVGHIFHPTGTNIRLTFRDFVLDGNRANLPAETLNSCISNSSADLNVVALYCDNVTFRNWAFSAVSLYGDNNDATVERLVMHGCRVFGGNESTTAVYSPRAVSFNNGVEGIVANCLFDFGRTPVTSGAGGVVIAQTQQITPHYSRAIVIGNTFKRMGRFEIASAIGVVDPYIWGDTCIIASNQFFNSYFTPIKPKASARNLVVIGNSIHAVHFTTGGAQTGGITINRATDALVTDNDNFVISGNIVRDVDAGDGIVVASNAGGGSENYLITGNIVDHVDGHGIYAEDVGNVSITGNQVRNTGQQGIRLNDCRDEAVVTGNRTHTTAGIGIVVGGTSPNLLASVSDNIVVAPTDYGIHTDQGRVLSVQDNIIADVALGTSRIGLRHGAPTFLALKDNILVGTVTLAVSAAGAPATKTEVGNSWQLP